MVDQMEEALTVLVELCRFQMTDINSFTEWYRDYEKNNADARLHEMNGIDAMRIAYNAGVQAMAPLLTSAEDRAIELGMRLQGIVCKDFTECDHWECKAAFAMDRYAPDMAAMERWIKILQGLGDRLYTIVKDTRPGEDVVLQEWEAERR